MKSLGISSSLLNSTPLFPGVCRGGGEDPHDVEETCAMLSESRMAVAEVGHSRCESSDDEHLRMRFTVFEGDGALDQCNLCRLDN